MNEQFATLGQRLDDQARRIATRSALTLPWAAPFEVFLDHLAALPSEGERFSRREVAEPAWPVRPSMWTGAAEPAGRPLAADTAARLRAVVGPGVETMRVHDDETADETARAHRSDAVTIGADVYFRKGQWNPGLPRGFGLLVHEATHVVERLRPGASWRQATAGGVAAEENLAQAREAAVLPTSEPAPAPERMGMHHSSVSLSPIHQTVVEPLSYPVAASPRTGSPPPVFTPAGPAPPPTAVSTAPPMTAAVDRPAAPPAPAPAAIDVDALQARITRDLMRQLRDEFERGA